MDILKLIKEKENQDYFTRMDEHKKLYALDKYVMSVNNKPISDVINITLNDPQTYADYIIATLTSSTQQIEVEGDKLLSGQAEKIEEMLHAIMDAAEERLTNIEYTGIDEFDFSMACLRGRVARRVTLRQKDGVFIPDLLPLDTRYFVYDMDEKGVKWGSYLIWKSKEWLKASYPKYKELSGMKDNTEYEVRDYWNKKEHRIYVESNEPFIEANPYGDVPFVVQVCNTGNNMLDRDMRKFKGNSVYAGVADLYYELNRVVSILATINVKTLENSMQYRSTEGTQGEAPKDSPFGLRKIFPVEKDGGYAAMPLEDIRQATTMLWNILEQRKQEATIASTRYGNLQFPLSAIAIKTLGSETDKILFPRIDAVAKLGMKSARMMIEQLKQIGGTVEVGEYGTYDTSILNGKYSIKYNYTQTSPQQDISNISIANSAKEFYSPDTIRRDILKVQDPGAEASKIRMAKYDAVGADNMTDGELYQVIHDLRDNDRNVEAELALQSLENRLRVRNQPAVKPAEQPTRAIETPTGQRNVNQNVIPLIDNSSNNRRATQPAITQGVQ